MFWIVLGLLSIIYGISVGWKNSGTFFYIIWFFIGAFFFLIHCMNVYSLWNIFPSIVWIVIGIVFGLGILLTLFLLGCIFSKYFSKGKKNAKYVIILGAQWKEKGPSKALKYRLDKALEYLKENEESLCIVSGGQGYNEPCSEADGMASYLIAHGIEEKRILREDQSTSTIENIRFSMKYIEDVQSSICIVTNAFHMYRALAIAKKQGLVNAYGLSGRSDLWYVANNTLREVFGIVKDYLMKNL